MLPVFVGRIHRREVRATRGLDSQVQGQSNWPIAFAMWSTTMKDVIKRKVLNVFSMLKRDDGTLFDCEIEESEYDSRKLHEVCINHRLAIYLEKEILPIISSASQKYFVDIEFNREGINLKKILECNGRERVVRPDIIIHNRKSEEKKENFLIVECKKIGASPAEIHDDREKVSAFLNDEKYKYSFGLQVVYGKDVIEGTLFYKDSEGFIKQEKITS
jgi:hypothetical protein